MSQSITSGSGAQGEGGGIGEEGEDQEDPSSSSTLEQSKDEELANFRAEWRKELKSSPVSQNPVSSLSPSISTTEESETDEEKARQLFLKGVENEQLGKLYEAIQFYRRAVQLVPDIEFRLYESTNQRPAVETPERAEDETEEDNLELEEEEEVEEFDPSQSDLTSHLQRVMSKSYCICQPKVPQKGLGCELWRSVRVQDLEGDVHLATTAPL
uniref:Uncharacterized protein n=1 Tax=Cuerna arida TaxID=1464854 RepID=A0A1B6H0D2_9HEMI